MKNNRIILFIFFITALFQVGVLAQNEEDARRLSSPGLGVGARSIGLGTAYTAISNDFSAVYWNPAGLGRIKTNEFSLGLSYLSYNNSTNFLSTQQSFTNSATNLNSVGLVYSYPVTRGSLVLAAGYDRQSDFTTALAFSGFRSGPSFLLQPDNINQLDSLDQLERILEGGGINNWVVAGAIEAAKGLYLGVSLNFNSGTYTYSQNYSQSDVYDLFLGSRIGVNYTVSGDIAGFTLRSGMLYMFPEKRGTFGLNVKFPTYLTLKDDYAVKEIYEFDTPDSNFATTTLSGISEYDFATPYVFSAGLSWWFGDLMLASSMDYTDWTQMEFRNTYPDLIEKNTDIKLIMQPTVNFHVGAEYQFSDAGLQLRGGFAYLPSPYRNHTSSNAQKYISGGLGLLIEETIFIDLGYAYGYRDITHDSQVWYNDQYVTVGTVSETIKTHNVVATLSYRF